MTGWQPIETAPKDGTVILTFDSVNRNNFFRGISLAYCKGKKKKKWIDTWADWVFHPTHWMPLPDPPNS